MKVLLLLAAIVAVGYSSLCPDEEYSCSDDQTCCKLSTGEWGCCPMPNAQCCNDHVHCCPDGSTCDTERGQCNTKNTFVPFQKKRPALRRNMENEVLCPDKKSKCPAEATCCQLQTGQYGCCPVTHAVCCSDRLHCCPPGFICDTTGERCAHSEKHRSMPWLKKFSSTPLRHKPAIEMNNAQKDDDSVLLAQLAPIACGYMKTCPGQHTCCAIQRLGRIHHMCCPLQNGVCCGDTCCPSGYHCRPGGKCEKFAIGDPLVDMF